MGGKETQLHAARCLPEVQPNRREDGASLPTSSVVVLQLLHRFQEQQAVSQAMTHSLHAMIGQATVMRLCIEAALQILPRGSKQAFDSAVAPGEAQPLSRRTAPVAARTIPSPAGHVARQIQPQALGQGALYPRSPRQPRPAPEPKTASPGGTRAGGKAAGRSSPLSPPYSSAGATTPRAGTAGLPAHLAPPGSTRVPPGSTSPASPLDSDGMSDDAPNALQVDRDAELLRLGSFGSQLEVQPNPPRSSSSSSDGGGGGVDAAGARGLLGNASRAQRGDRRWRYTAAGVTRVNGQGQHVQQQQGQSPQPSQPSQQQQQQQQHQPSRQERARALAQHSPQAQQMQQLQLAALLLRPQLEPPQSPQQFEQQMQLQQQLQQQLQRQQQQQQQQHQHQHQHHMLKPGQSRTMAAGLPQRATNDGSLQQAAPYTILPMLPTFPSLPSAPASSPGYQQTTSPPPSRAWPPLTRADSQPAAAAMPPSGPNTDQQLPSVGLPGEAAADPCVSLWARSGSLTSQDWTGLGLDSSGWGGAASGGLVSLTGLGGQGPAEEDGQQAAPKRRPSILPEPTPPGTGAAAATAAAAAVAAAIAAGTSAVADVAATRVAATPFASSHANGRKRAATAIPGMGTGTGMEMEMALDGQATGPCVEAAPVAPAGRGQAPEAAARHFWPPHSWDPSPHHNSAGPPGGAPLQKLQPKRSRRVLRVPLPSSASWVATGPGAGAVAFAVPVRGAGAGSCPQLGLEHGSGSGAREGLAGAVAPGGAVPVSPSADSPIGSAGSVPADLLGSLSLGCPPAARVQPLLAADAAGTSPSADCPAGGGGTAGSIPVASAGGLHAIAGPSIPLAAAAGSETDAANVYAGGDRAMAPGSAREASSHSLPPAAPWWSLSSGSLPAARCSFVAPLAPDAPGDPWLQQQQQRPPPPPQQQQHQPQLQHQPTTTAALWADGPPAFNALTRQDPAVSLRADAAWRSQQPLPGGNGALALLGGQPESAIEPLGPHAPAANTPAGGIAPQFGDRGGLNSSPEPPAAAAGGAYGHVLHKRAAPASMAAPAVAAGALAGLVPFPGGTAAAGGGGGGDAGGGAAGLASSLLEPASALGLDPPTPNTSAGPGAGSATRSPHQNHNHHHNHQLAAHDWHARPLELVSGAGSGSGAAAAANTGGFAAGAGKNPGTAPRPPGNLTEARKQLELKQQELLLQWMLLQQQQELLLQGALEMC